MVVRGYHTCRKVYLPDEAPTMSSRVNIECAQTHLQQIIAGLNPGEMLTITKDGEPAATLTRSSLKAWPCKAGSAKDTSHWMAAADFNALLEVDYTRLLEKTR